MLFENIRLAFRSFATSRMRAFLSVLGIVIGVAAVIAIATLGRSATSSVQEEIARIGLGTIALVPEPGNDPMLIRLFTPELAGRLRREVGGIRAVMPMNTKSCLMEHAGARLRGQVVAVTDEAVGIFDLKLTEGRFISGPDRQRRSAVVVLGAEAADVLFPTSRAVGKHVRLFLDPTRSFKVVGVIETRPDSMGISFDASAIVPFETYSSRVERLTRVGRYVVGVFNETEVLTVSSRVELYFRQLTGSRTAIRLVSPYAVAEMFDAVTSTMNAFLTGIAAISLIVGGVGIMNIMFVSVTERTKEIGIRKALGASPRIIRGQFLTEAVTLTVFGGILGTVLGTVLSYWGTWLFGWIFSPNPVAYPLALVFSSAVGIFFGLQPAVRASRLDPVQALTYE